MTDTPTPTPLPSDFNLDSVQLSFNIAKRKASQATEDTSQVVIFGKTNGLYRLNVFAIFTKANPSDVVFKIRGYNTKTGEANEFTPWLHSTEVVMQEASELWKKHTGPGGDCHKPEEPQAMTTQQAPPTTPTRGAGGKGKTGTVPIVRLPDWQWRKELAAKYNGKWFRADKSEGLRISHAFDLPTGRKVVKGQAPQPGPNCTRNIGGLKLERYALKTNHAYAYVYRLTENGNPKLSNIVHTFTGVPPTLKDLEPPPSVSAVGEAITHIAPLPPSGGVTPEPKAAPVEKAAPPKGEDPKEEDEIQAALRLLRTAADKARAEAEVEIQRAYERGYKEGYEKHRAEILAALKAPYGP